MMSKKQIIFSILLCAILLVASAKASLFQFEYEKNIPVFNNAEIVIGNARGDIIIEGSDNTDIRIKAFKVIKADHREEAEKLAEFVKINIKQKSNLINIETKFNIPKESKSFLESLLGSKTDNSDATVNFVLIIPTNSRIELSSKIGDVKISNLVGDLFVENSSGNVSINDITGDLIIEKIEGSVIIDRTTGSLDLRTGGANIEISDADGPLNLMSISGSKNFNRISGNMHLEQSSGSINISELNGNLKAKSGSGDITAIQNSGSFNFSSLSGQIDLKTALDGVEKSTLETESGDIFIAIPEHSRANLRIETKAGRINSRIPIKTDSASSNQIDGTIGGGGPEVRLWSESGSINLTGY